MVKVIFFKNQQGEIIRFTASGHTNLSRKGNDILCAAVSALVQGAVIGLECYSQPGVEKRDESGFIDVWLGKKSEVVEAIVNTLFLSLKRIEQEYHKHLQVSCISLE